jgi:hypothetical protein
MRDLAHQRRCLRVNGSNPRRRLHANGSNRRGSRRASVRIPQMKDAASKAAKVDHATRIAGATDDS